MSVAFIDPDFRPAKRRGRQGVGWVFVVVGLGIFLATFDADRYRPVVVKQLASALGRPVRLERLSLGWRGGLALQLNGLAVFRDPASPEPIAQAERVSATLQLLPLFQRQLELSTLDIANGRLRLCDFSGPNQPCLRGTLNGSFQGAAQGLAWPEASRSLSGQGRLMLTEARIEHLNILRE
ncbi:MAG: hypothetical protein HYY91_01015, partial [Candidatus Omnitrophica bacterium]|nr:hypothetical protein [Candidatus Omnitrophota bacterium]